MNEEKKPIVPQRVADINAQIAAQGNKGYSVAPGTTDSQGKLVAGSQPITSALLSNSETPLTIPQVNQSSASSGLSAISSSVVPQTREATKIEQETQKKAEEEKGFLTRQKEKIQGLMQSVIGVQGSQAGLEAEAKLPEKAQKVTDVTNQIEALDRAETNELRALDTANMTAAGSQAAQAGIRRKYAFEKADLALIQSAANRDLLTAQSIVDRKIQLQLEGLNNQLDFERMFYEENKDAFSTAEKRAFETKINEDERRYAENKSFETQKGNLQMQLVEAGAPASAILATGRATNQTELALAAGNYLVKPISGGTGGSGGASGTFGGTQYASDLDAIIGATLSTIPTKFGQQTFNEQMARARDDADRVSLVAAQVLKGQPAEFKNDFRNQAVGISMIDKAIAELDNGAKTGAIQAGKQYAANFLGKDFDPALAKINGYITSAIQPYRNSVTGAAWGDQEDAEYQQLFGSIKYSPAELKQRLLQTKELLKSKSAEGLNAFVNPLGTYGNQFETGDLAPQGSENPEDIFDSVISGESAESSSWIKNAWNSLFN